jgi:hypothetical protein
MKTSKHLATGKNYCDDFDEFISTAKNELYVAKKTSEIFI